ncbi:hypothetical protein SAMN04487995_0122 [Dyadobacter koreensis]|uniref:Uncharacterized protein n=1 Tax=Dyadobacter koreensis TaxID=408657 RepID=A0A1H6Q694_9BACT|nr:hypothetical protein [Dyadobacter koreensis]SEI37406.1 hypothetical protein SAMN04487995_0122 [Dyadobacter koreensis]
MEQNLEPGDLVESSFDGIWNVQSVESTSVKCFRYDDDWERHEKEFKTEELKTLYNSPDNIIIENGDVRLSSGGPVWTVSTILQTTASCKMPQEFDFMEVELPLKSLMNVTNEEQNNIDL